MKRNISIIALLIIVIALKAQDKQWTLDDCMAYAVENSPKNRNQKAQNSIYHQNYIEAIGRLLPSISANTNANFNFGRALDPETNTYNNINSFNNGYGLYGSLTIFDGLANLSRLKMQKINKLMGKQQLQQTEDEIAYQTMEAYFNAQYYSEMVTLAEKQLEESTNNLKQVKRMEELGVKGFPDVAEMQAKEAEDNYNLTKQHNILTIGIIILKEKMNFPLEDTLVITPYQLKEIVAKSPDKAYTIYEQSLSYTPKALAAQSSVDAQKQAYRMAKGGLYPTISFNAGFSTNFSRYMDGSTYKSFSTQVKDKRGHYFEFSLSLPIFSGFSRSAQAKRGRSQLIMAESERDQTLRTLYSEIEQSIADMNGQADQYIQALKQVEAMKVAHDVNQRKYNEGLVSALELHTSANRLLKAKTDELNACLQYELKHRLVDYYKGKPFIQK